ncbi:energy transducer TonB [Mucilaginibacter celer]|nr:energy transducer TonB [Mucilaginibacter celer]
MIVILWLSKSANAQVEVDTIISYMKYDRTSAAAFQAIPVKDTAGADFIRMITVPDSNINSSLYQVYDYYLNGTLKFRGGSTTSSFQIQLDGAFVEFYPDGHKKRMAAYKYGRLNGRIVEYYPDGKVYLTGSYDIDGLKVDSCNDLAGKSTVEKGLGKQTLYNDNFKIIGGGALLNGRRDGVWKSVLNDSVAYEITYAKGKLVSGIGYDTKTGAKYPFSQIQTLPDFKGGLEAFAKYIEKQLHYPSAAKQNNIQGRVILEFVVDKNGSVRDIKVVRGIGYGCDEAAVQVLRECPRWTPGTYYGLPVNIRYSVPVNFSFNRR